MKDCKMAACHFLHMLSEFRCYFLAFWLAGILGITLAAGSEVLAEEYAEEYAQEDGGDEEWVEEIPDSYYYPIETNELTGWPQGPMIEAASAAVMDMDSGAFLYSKNATAKQYPASTTKIMTTLLLVENCNLDETITFSEIVFDLEEGSSHLGIHPGEEMTLRDCAYGIMLASANDIANGVAEYMGGSLAGFADMMNARAAELGCVNTHFSNPHGLYSDDHYTCAYDMALIGRAAYSNPIFREIAGTTYYEIPETNLTDEIRYLVQHHKMTRSSEEEYYRDWCTGGKTGYTEACLNTLVTFGEKDGQRLVGVILRVNGAGKAYLETAQIMEYGFQNFCTENISIEGTNTSFYAIMGLDYPGGAGHFQSPVWQRNASSDTYLTVTTPNGLSRRSLTREVFRSDHSLERTIAYSYEGWPMGTARGTFYPIAAPAMLYLERTSPFLELNRSISGSGDPVAVIPVSSLKEAAGRVGEMAVSGYEAIRRYSGDNLLLIVAVAAVLLLILILLGMVLIFRANSGRRLKKRRQQEEEELRRKEEEIDRMTTAEIEAELREAMKAEHLRQDEGDFQAGQNWPGDMP